MFRPNTSRAAISYFLADKYKPGRVKILEKARIFKKSNLEAGVLTKRWACENGVDISRGSIVHHTLLSPCIGQKDWKIRSALVAFMINDQLNYQIIHYQ